MVMINLLPWRAQQLAYERKQCLLVVALSAAMSTCLIMILYACFLYQIEQIKSALTISQEKLQQTLSLHQLIQPSLTKDLSDDANQSQQDQRATLALLNLLGQMSGHEVCLIKISRQSGRLIVTGETIEARYLLEKAKAWQAAFPQIKIVHMRQHQRFYRFRLQALEEAKQASEFSKKRHHAL